jgi:spore maturation protein CgeB
LKVRLFCHSIISDWNNGHAHFLRGIVTELIERGNDVIVFEEKDCWSLKNALRERVDVVESFHRRFPSIRVIRYDRLQLDSALLDADLVIVQEWCAPSLIAELSALRARDHRFILLFHDPHHRALTEPSSIEKFDLRHFDGVLAFGQVIREIYLQRGWARQAWTWHEAADTRIFHPIPSVDKDLELVWIGNWGDGERAAELLEFLIHPIKQLSLKAAVFGVRYPAEALSALASAGIAYGGWLANADVPSTLARARVTVHVPRRPYARWLHGIPTIRPFEAMACGIPLVCGPWIDSEQLFSPGLDFLFADDGEQMTAHLARILEDTQFSDSLASSGLRTIRDRHSCRHRVDELLSIYNQLVERRPRIR